MQRQSDNFYPQFSVEECYNGLFVVHQPTEIWTKGPRSGQAKVARELYEKSCMPTKPTLTLPRPRYWKNMPWNWSLLEKTKAKFWFPAILFLLLSVPSVNPLSVFSTGLASWPVFSLFLCYAHVGDCFFLSSVSLLHFFCALFYPHFCW